MQMSGKSAQVNLFRLLLKITVQPHQCMCIAYSTMKPTDHETTYEFVISNLSRSIASEEDQVGICQMLCVFVGNEIRLSGMSTSWPVHVS